MTVATQTDQRFDVAVLGAGINLANEGMTCILLTHEMGFAREIADHVYFTDRGVIVEHGPPAELFAKPQDPRTRKFFDQIL